MLFGAMFETETAGNADEICISSCPFNVSLPGGIFAKVNPRESPSSSIYSGFRLPIEYVPAEELFSVSDVVTADLELARRTTSTSSTATATTDTSFCCFSTTTSPHMYSGGCDTPTETTTANIYEHFIQPTNVFSGEMTRDIQKHYTTNISFLKDTQDVLEHTDEYIATMDTYMKTQMTGFVPSTEKFNELWQDLKENGHFHDTYSYLDWSFLEYLNHSSDFLQMFSCVNIVSPLFSLFVPILFFIFPFLLLRIQQIDITIDQYIDTLRAIAKNHVIGKLLSSDFSIQGIAYLAFTIGLYCLQTYQNVNSCIRYYNNIAKVNQRLEYMRDHLKQSIMRMNTFVQIHKQKSTYRSFCIDVERHANCLEQLHAELVSITPFSISFTKFNNIGYMLKWYYELYSSPVYEASIRYSLGFGAYMDILMSIRVKQRLGYLGKATFTETDALAIRDQYYPTHSSAVKNSCNLRKNMIITGVNASGKTTFIKTTAINIILTQQFGVGFYSACKIRPFTQIHSYLNIPDTSGRDSLFQAESRRCKTIIDAIESSKHDIRERHFVIFDELYSGTNPEEATKSAISLLRYLASFDNVRFMLTTHYVKVCKKFRKFAKISNYKMNVELNEHGRIHYLYTIQKGISKINGGVEILKMMNYPEEILRDIQDNK